MNSVRKSRMPTKEEIEELYIAQGMPMWKVAEALGVSVGTVFNYSKKFGIKAKKQSDYETSEKVRKAWKEIGKKSKGRKHSDKSKKKMSEAKKRGGIGHKKHRDDGYIAIYFPDHPKCNSEGYILEHILVMEALVGRHLSKDECVHHINGKRDDNRAENLKLMTKSEHMSHHMKERWEKKRRNDLSIQSH